jgi:hypothetical protein
MSKLNLNLNSELRRSLPGARDVRRIPRERSEAPRASNGLLWSILLGATALVVAIHIWRSG